MVLMALKRRVYHWVSRQAISSVIWKKCMEIRNTRQYEDGGRNWLDVTTPQGMSGLIKNVQTGRKWFFHGACPGSEALLKSPFQLTETVTGVRPPNWEGIHLSCSKVPNMHFYSQKKGIYSCLHTFDYNMVLVNFFYKTPWPRHLLEGKVYLGLLVLKG